MQLVGMKGHYVIEGIVATVVSAGVISFFSWIGYLLKKADRDRKQGRECDLALLYDKLEYLCEKHIKKGDITLAERKNLIILFDAYDAIGGNHGIHDQVEQALALPIKTD